MAVLDILRWPDPSLKAVCDPITPGEDVRGFVADMFDTMYAAPGRGLAASQVGVLARVFVMDCTWKEGTPSPRACLNPQILWRSDAMAVHTEGCLSIPGVSADVPRPAEVILRWHDLDWAVHEARLSGFEAVCAQHEFDHLEGRVYLNYLAPGALRDLMTAYEVLK
jgi:peptide deformylase